MEELMETGKFDPKSLSLPELIAELASYGIKHRPSKKLNYQLISEIKAYELDCQLPTYIMWLQDLLSQSDLTHIELYEYCFL